MRYAIIMLLLLGGCGLGQKKNAAEEPVVSARDRELAQCEMQALESIPDGPNAEERIERYTLLCMQARGYPTRERTMKVIIRDDASN